MKLRRAAAMLRRFAPSDEELTAADILDAVSDEHTMHDRMCVACDESWPCARYTQAEQLAVRALGWAIDRHAANAWEVLGAPPLTPTDSGPLPRRRLHVVRAVGPSDDDLMRYRYPPDGDVDRWVREGPPGHVNYPGKTEESA